MSARGTAVDEAARADGGGGARPIARKPAWLRVGIPSGENARHVSGLVARGGLATVCDSARCPNKAECWGAATATFMVLGSTCTRFCRFCAVEHRGEGDPLQAEEPQRLARAVAELGLAYAVVTSVDRDDLPDRGAAHFAACARALKALKTPTGDGLRVELLVPDYREGEIEPILDSGCDVLAHNIETVERLQGLRDGRASYAASLRTLALAAAYARGSSGSPRANSGGAPLVKSSIMLGLGEERGEVLRSMDELREAGCSALVLGQYLRPTKAQVDVVRYLDPEEFARYADDARERGFAAVVSAPLARTSYRAHEAFRQSPSDLRCTVPRVAAD
jgi:lipoyl synthase